MRHRPTFRRRAFVVVTLFGVARVVRGFQSLVVAPAVARVISPALRASLIRLRALVASKAPRATGRLAAKLALMPLRQARGFAVRKLEASALIPQEIHDQLFAIEFASVTAPTTRVGFLRGAVDNARVHELRRIEADIKRDFQTEIDRAMSGAQF